MQALLNATQYGVAHWHQLAGGSALLLITAFFAVTAAAAARSLLTTPDWKRNRDGSTNWTETDFLKFSFGALLFGLLAVDVLSTGGQTISNIADGLSRRC